jgi:hypothetical protein
MSDDPESSERFAQTDPNREPSPPEPAPGTTLAGPIGPTPRAIDPHEVQAKAARWARLGDRRWRWPLSR